MDWMKEIQVPSKSRFWCRSDTVSGALLVLIAGYIIWMNQAYPLGSLAEPGPGYVPLLLALFMGAMGLIVMGFGFKSVSLDEMAWSESGRALAIIVACGVASYALERWGYRLSIGALLIFFLGVMERLPIKNVILVSVGFSGLTFYLFSTLLRVPLPVSPWGF
jgi:hypothetical protein